jgi:hypothetical protein
MFHGEHLPVGQSSYGCGANPLKMGMGVDKNIGDAPAATSFGESTHIIDSSSPLSEQRRRTRMRAVSIAAAARRSVS